jgi:hypothetical protein
MEKFIERQNITKYSDHLKTEIDPAKRIILQKLLAEETTKQASQAKHES